MSKERKIYLKRICSHCNKEFNVTHYSETYDSFVTAIMNCPLCGKRNDIWVTYCKDMELQARIKELTKCRCCGKPGEGIHTCNRSKCEIVAGMATEHDRLERQLLSDITALEAQNRLLAQLSADEPLYELSSPLVVAKACAIRDEILALPKKETE